MMIEKFKPPSQIAGKNYLSARAGKFSGVPQRTVQAWTDAGLIIPATPTSGTGDRRKYSVLNCIEIGIIRSLSRDRLSFPVITQVMEALRTGSPLTLEQVLSYDQAYMILRFYKSGNVGATVVSNKPGTFGPRSGVKGEKRSFQSFWVNTTIPEDGDHVKTLIVDLKFISSEVLKEMAGSG